VIGLLADDWSEAEIIANYPGVARDDIMACLAYEPARKDAPVWRKPLSTAPSRK
jgi:uncharacterized protein (DUF433 family)